MRLLCGSLTGCYEIDQCLNSFIEWEAIQNREMPWLAAQMPGAIDPAFGGGGLLYYAMDRWLPHGLFDHNHTAPIARLNGTARTDFDPDASAKSNGQGQYFYPGGAAWGPVSSQRYEALRDGIEDAQLVVLARAASVDPTPELESVITGPAAAARTSDPEVVEKARMALAKKIAKSS